MKARSHRRSTGSFTPAVMPGFSLLAQCTKVHTDEDGAPTGRTYWSTSGPEGKDGLFLSTNFVDPDHAVAGTVLLFKGVLIEKAQPSRITEAYPEPGVYPQDFVCEDYFADDGSEIAANSAEAETPPA